MSTTTLSAPPLVEAMRVKLANLPKAAAPLPTLTLVMDPALPSAIWPPLVDRPQSDQRERLVLRARDMRRRGARAPHLALVEYATADATQVLDLFPAPAPGGNDVA